MNESFDQGILLGPGHVFQICSHLVLIPMPITFCCWVNCEQAVFCLHNSLCDNKDLLVYLHGILLFIQGFPSDPVVFSLIFDFLMELNEHFADLMFCSSGSLDSCLESTNWINTFWRNWCVYSERFSNHSSACTTLTIVQLSCSACHRALHTTEKNKSF